MERIERIYVCAASFTAFENFVMDLRDSNDHENGTNEPTTQQANIRKE